MSDPACVGAELHLSPTSTSEATGDFVEVGRRWKKRFHAETRKRYEAAGPKNPGKVFPAQVQEK